MALWRSGVQSPSAPFIITKSPDLIMILFLLSIIALIGICYSWKVALLTFVIGFVVLYIIGHFTLKYDKNKKTITNVSPEKASDNIDDRDAVCNPVYSSLPSNLFHDIDWSHSSNDEKF